MERWLCGEGKRWKRTELTRMKNEPSLEDFFTSERGDVLTNVKEKV